jgi:hypothetical protein
MLFPISSEVLERLREVEVCQSVLSHSQMDEAKIVEELERMLLV